MKLSRAIAAILLLLLPLAGHAQTPPPAAAPMTLRLKYTHGEVLHYKVTTDTDMTMTTGGPSAQTPAALPAINEQMAMDMVQTVQSVNPADGSATILEHMGPMTGTLNSQPIPGLSDINGMYMNDFTIVMSPGGKMLSMTIPPSAAGKMPDPFDISKLGGVAPNMLPTGPVRVGDTWDGDTDLSSRFQALPGAAGMKMKIQSTLAAIDTSAQPVADIRQTFTSNITTATPAGAAGTVQTAGTLAGTSTVKFDVTGGTMLSQDGTTNMDMTIQMPKPSPTSTAAPQPLKMKMQMTTHLTLLPTAAPAP
jgi:hypothetical protein